MFFDTSPAQSSYSPNGISSRGKTEGSPSPFAVEASERVRSALALYRCVFSCVFLPVQTSVQRCVQTSVEVDTRRNGVQR